jgi:hypothetical protein
MKKHIAQNTDTGSRYLVALLQIPQRPDHALVIQTDGMPPRFEQTVMQIAQSNEGQAEVDLANALARRMYEDTGKTVLATLHERGLMKPVHIDKVTMFPHPAMAIPLRHVLKEMGRTIPGDAPEKQVVEKFNPVVNNMAAASLEERLQIARNLLLQADDLQGVANRKREEAYRYAPELRPVTKVEAEDASEDTTSSLAFEATFEDNALTALSAVDSAATQAEQAKADGRPVLTAEQIADILEGKATVEQFQQAAAPTAAVEAAPAPKHPQLTPEQIADLFEGKVTLEQLQRAFAETAPVEPAQVADEAPRKARKVRTKAG